MVLMESYGECWAVQGSAKESGGQCWVVLRGEIQKSRNVPFYSDVNFTITMATNCHYMYFAASMATLATSYFETVYILKSHVGLSWIKAIFYPYYYGRNFFRHIKKRHGLLTIKQALKI